ncbi:MAG: RidA family protein [Candidatus Tectomicrobia bacterium]|nr:RidA family protein [Candidatus Tectomicrobia bacterium]
MAKAIIQMSSPAASIGPYSPGAGGEGVLFLSGRAALDPAGRVVAPGDPRAQTMETLKGIQAVLAAAGGRMEDVVKTTVFLSDMRHYAAMNEAYAKFFPRDPPARSTVLARPPQAGLLVEIDVIAIVGD